MIEFTNKILKIILPVVIIAVSSAHSATAQSQSDPASPALSQTAQEPVDEGDLNPGISTIDEAGNIVAEKIEQLGATASDRLGGWIDSKVYADISWLILLFCLLLVFVVVTVERVVRLLIQRKIETIPHVDGEISCDPAEDIVKVAAVDRRHGHGKTATGLIKGFGLGSGAFGCSAAWDCSDIIVVGASEADMAAVVNRIGQLQGGIVVANDGALLAEIATPIFGLISPEPVKVIVEQLNGVKQALQSLGVRFADPLLTLVTLTGAAIPYLRICEEGLVNLKDGQTVDLLVESTPGG